MRTGAQIDETAESDRARSLYVKNSQPGWRSRWSFCAGRTSGLDVDNLIEELEGLTKRDERALGS